MKVYKILYDKDIVKLIKKIDKKDKALITRKIESLEQGNFSGDKKLKGKLKNYYRKRAGNYRIIYTKQEDFLIIKLIRIKHRKEIY